VSLGGSTRCASSRILATTVSVNDLRRRVGARIRQMRLTGRLTQEQLAERAGLSYKFVGEVERGTGNPTVDSLAALARAFGVDLTEFFRISDRTGGPPSPVELSEQDFNEIRDALSQVEQILARLMPARQGRSKRR
jgi:transcriptional regulator with XRE-family HTH domain